MKLSLSPSHHADDRRERLGTSSRAGAPSRARDHPLRALRDGDSGADEELLEAPRRRGAGRSSDEPAVARAVGDQRRERGTLADVEAAFQPGPVRRASKSLASVSTAPVTRLIPHARTSRASAARSSPSSVGSPWPFEHEVAVPDAAARRGARARAPPSGTDSPARAASAPCRRSRASRSTPAGAEPLVVRVHGLPGPRGRRRGRRCGADPRAARAAPGEPGGERRRVRCRGRSAPEPAATRRTRVGRAPPENEPTGP